ncbi:MAG: FAD-dependent monooxygenase [Gemmatimonadota bacterium]
MHHTDLLVIGAGPAGAATAARAAAAGLRVTLVDRARFPRDKPCAEYLSPETVRQLDLLDALPPAVRSAGHALAGTTVHGPGGAQLTGLFAQVESDRHGPRPAGLALPRLILDAAILDVARGRGAVVREGLALDQLLYHRGTVAGGVFRTRDGQLETISARLTVGADGIRSRVARQIGGYRTGSPSRLAFVGHLDGVSDLTDRAEMHVGAEGYVGINPLGGTRANVSAVVPTALSAGASGRPEEYFRQVLASFPALRHRLARTEVIRAVMVTGPFGGRARRLVAGGALLVGDAAEFFDPFTGEGICTALRSATLAVDTALEALATPGLVARPRLAGYARAHRRAFAGKRVVERLIGYAMFTPRLFDRAVERVERRGWSHTLIGVTGDMLPPSLVLNPRFLTGLVFG